MKPRLAVLPKQNKFVKWSILSAFLFLLALVLLNLFSPLRLNNDAGRYLGIVEFLKGGLSSKSDAAHDFLPHGYPYFLFVLNKLHLLYPFTITLFNILSVLLAAFLLTGELAVKNRLFYLSLVLISFINIKEYAIPVSDQVFSILFMLSIICWSRGLSGNLYYLIPAVIITALSVYFRTAAIAIIVGMAGYLVSHHKNAFKKPSVFIPLSVLLIFGVVMLFASFSLVEKKIDYVRQLNVRGLFSPSNLLERLFIHLKELGEIIINIPYSRLSVITDRHGLSVASPLLIMVGITSLIIYFIIVRQLKLTRSLLFWVGTAYLLMIFAWPFYDTRFLIPILPVLIFLYIYYLFNGLKNKYIRVGLLSVYTAFGLISLLYSDALSLNKNFFLSHYGADSYLRAVYRAHFTRQSQGRDTIFDIKKDYVPFILEEYDHEPFQRGQPIKRPSH